MALRFGCRWCFGAQSEEANLNGIGAYAIHSDLSAASSNLVKALPQPENLGVSFMGDTKGGAFGVEGKLARAG